MFVQNCGKCAKDSNLQETWNCIGPAGAAYIERMPGDGGEIFEYYTCPVNFVVPRVWNFLREYKAIKNGMALPEKFSETDAWFNWARVHYESWFNFCMSKKNNG